MDKIKLKTLLISPGMPLKQAMQKLNETAEKILFAVDENNRLLGTITDGDIRRGIINGLEFGEKIEKIMYKKFVSISAALTLTEREESAEKIMLKSKIEQIPVVSADREIIDVILWTDVIKEKKHIEPKEIYPNQVVIMAGGKGTRLDPFTKILPKPLIPIGNKPVIELIMDKFNKCGFNKFIYTLNYKKEYIKIFLKENKFPYSIDWVEESDFLGTVGGLALLREKITDTFFVTNCDSILEIDFDKVLKWHKEHKASMTIIGCHNEVKIPFGVLELSNGRLDRILEKPVHDVMINVGVYVMEPHIISYIPKDKPSDMNNLIDTIIKKEKISVYPIHDGWFDIGQWAEYKNSVEKLGNII